MLRVTNGNELFNDDILALISELMENPEFAELWKRASAELDETNSTLDLEADCIVAYISWHIMLDHNPSKDEVVSWLFDYLG